MRFERRPNARCQRGLGWDDLLAAPAPAYRDTAAVGAALKGPLVEGQERCAGRTVERLILQFEVEVRVGERDRQVAALFRSCCPAPRRRELLARLDAAIEQP